MATVATTHMSSKGQVVIPESVREDLGLKPGAQFMVMGDKDVVILKTIAQLSMKDFTRLVRNIRSQARAAGLKEADILSATRKVRSAR